MIDSIFLFHFSVVSAYNVQRTVFAHSRVPSIYPWLFYIGTTLSFARLEVRRFASEAAQEDVELARKLNRADYALYEAAQNITGRHVVMYESYGDFALHNSLLLFVVFWGLFCTGVLLCVFCSSVSTWLCPQRSSRQFLATCFVRCPTLFRTRQFFFRRKD